MATAATNPIGIILAGGKSSRMGSDKAALRINGESLLKRMSRILLAAGCTQIILSGHCREDWEDRFIPDLLPNLGPVGGIISVMFWAKNYAPANTSIVFVPVDAPLLSAELIASLHRYSDSSNGCYISDSPLPLVLKTTEDVFSQSDFAFNDFEAKGTSWSVRRFIDPLCLKGFDVNAQIKTQLTNVNTTLQWESLLRELENLS
jgi:molybdopterin-guanine dinucleotide biosynthesis protein A